MHDDADFEQLWRDLDRQLDPLPELMLERDREVEDWLERILREANAQVERLLETVGELPRYWGGAALADRAAPGGDDRKWLTRFSSRHKKVLAPKTALPGLIFRTP